MITNNDKFQEHPLNNEKQLTKWIEREENSEADKLSRQAYEAYCKKHGIEVKYHDG